MDCSKVVALKAREGLDDTLPFNTEHMCDGYTISIGISQGGLCLGHLL